jgi:molybdopterin-guanine dinucleotide biosynthesis protein A
MREIGGQTILARAIARLRPQCEVLILNANGDPGRFAAFGLPVIADSADDYPGPLTGHSGRARMGGPKSAVG